MKIKLSLGTKIFLIALVIISVLGLSYFSYIRYYERYSNEIAIENTMPPKVTHLTKAILAAIRYELKDHNITDGDLVKEATKHDYALISPFQKYDVLIKRNKRNLILMIGNKNMNYAMFQDYSWSDDLDFNYLQTGEKVSFEITAEVPLN